MVHMVSWVLPMAVPSCRTAWSSFSGSLLCPASRLLQLLSPPYRALLERLGKHHT